ncbi:MAG: zinc-dependent metalloprotease [Bacteroidota bacterium]
MKILTISPPLLALLMLMLANSNFGFSQERNYRRYETQNVHQRLLKEYPEMKERIQQIERFVSTYEANNSNGKITIPVVFHVFFQEGQDYPSTEQIVSQLETLNRDFNRDKSEYKHEADSREGFDRKVAKLDIDFCFPKTDPDGNKIDQAINYIQVKENLWQTTDKMKSRETGGMSPWETKSYLNIYVVDLEAPASGYAQMPGGPEATDGIVIDFDFFGVSETNNPAYNQGKTLTHLIGSYLGLYELWNSIDPCSDDYVDDTPIHNAPNNKFPGYEHISTCPNNEERYAVEMSMNFMDNTEDEALYMFTLGQKNRIRAMVSEGGPRHSLTQTKVQCNNSNQSANLQVLSQANTDIEQGLHVFPNPVGSELNIVIKIPSLASGNVLEIINSQGQISYKAENFIIDELWQQKINVNDWPTGIYIIRLSNKDTQISKQLIISRQN